MARYIEACRLSKKKRDAVYECLHAYESPADIIRFLGYPKQTVYDNKNNFTRKWPLMGMWRKVLGNHHQSGRITIKFKCVRDVSAWYGFTWRTLYTLKMNTETSNQPIAYPQVHLKILNDIFKEKVSLWVVFRRMKVVLMFVFFFLYTKESCLLLVTGAPNIAKEVSCLWRLKLSLKSNIFYENPPKKSYEKNLLDFFLLHQLTSI